MACNKVILDSNGGIIATNSGSFGVSGVNEDSNEISLTYKKGSVAINMCSALAQGTLSS